MDLVEDLCAFKKCCQIQQQYQASLGRQNQKMILLEASWVVLRNNYLEDWVYKLRETELTRAQLIPLPSVNPKCHLYHCGIFQSNHTKLLLLLCVTHSPKLNSDSRIL